MKILQQDAVWKKERKTDRDHERSDSGSSIKWEHTHDVLERNTRMSREHIDDYPQKLGAEQKTPICNFISHHEKVCDAKKATPRLHTQREYMNYEEWRIAAHATMLLSFSSLSRKRSVSEGRWLWLFSAKAFFILDSHRMSVGMMQKDCISRPHPAATTFDIVVDISHRIGICSVHSIEPNRIHWIIFASFLIAHMIGVCVCV